MASDPQQDSRNLRNDSEDFRTVPQDSEAFRNVPNDAEARESHTLTVKEVARMFEEAGVARTERSVVNWCRATAGGEARLDSFFDANERKHFITPESVDRAIKEELAKVGATARPPVADPRKRAGDLHGEKRTEEMKLVIQDLEINNRVKDKFIERLQEDRKELFEERKGLVDRLAVSSQAIGRLKEKLLRLEGPRGNIDRQIVTIGDKHTASETPATDETERSDREFGSGTGAT